ncbi:hypothetical protein FRC07_014904 [Ceratobasidium sp. 392]|nr:hypothetical protein FRC07_014904 [Ceratobasidium sp. 392]
MVRRPCPSDDWATVYYTYPLERYNGRLFPHVTNQGMELTSSRAFYEASLGPDLSTISERDPVACIPEDSPRPLIPHLTLLLADSPSDTHLDSMTFQSPGNAARKPSGSSRHGGAPARSG